MTVVRCRAGVPVFFTGTFLGVLVPCVVGPKPGLVGFTTTAGAGAALAFPLTAMTWGEPGASSVSVRLAVRNPAASGVNVTVMVHEALTGMALLQAGSEKPKSLVFGPTTATFVMCSAAVPALVTVTFIGVLDPTAVLPKSRVPGVDPRDGTRVS